ncbi:class II glutamine amidotransferase [Desulfovibrio inopinatus]|uniref:class II glutamine amidotransferase n=1 Tax=Desulfovibrio inopinatus TaxID=102109 RepID=UPI00041884A9|nr:glutamine amidotransferase family protein [Desulfovibrio inopinatus]
MKAPLRDYDFQKDIAGCGVFGVIDKKKNRIPGSMPIQAMCTMHDRGNGLGGGFAAYGIYPELAGMYAFHLMADDQHGLDQAEEILKHFFRIHESQPIPTRKTLAIATPPLVWRFFLSMPERRPEWVELSEEDYIVAVVMHINTRTGAFVLSSGKNMGAFKGVGFPEDIAEFFRLDEYSAYLWTGHNRFPTNSPGWWGGAHPFTILDWSIVHNGEISSYGINKRYLCEHDYECTLMTDTEVVAYLLDLLVRKHGLTRREAAWVFAPPFWDEIDRMPEPQKNAFTALRSVYGSAMLNGPFAILVADSTSLMGLNDRIKLRPLVIGEQGDRVFMSSEESSIRDVQPDLDRVFNPKAGEPVIVEVEG